jgi:uncharacterized membrane protein
MGIKMQKNKKIPDPLDVRIRVLVAVILSFFLAFVGVGDALYLTIEHYQQKVSYCPIFGSGCDNILLSKYSVIAGIPVSVLGVLYYLTIMILMALYLFHKRKILLQLFIFLSTAGMLFTAYLFYIQWFLVQSFCFYCMLSAIFSASIFLCALIVAWTYRYIDHT